jgi:hypothetical protein
MALRWVNLIYDAPCHYNMPNHSRGNLWELCIFQPTMWELGGHGPLRRERERFMPTTTLQSYSISFFWLCNLPTMYNIRTFNQPHQFFLLTRMRFVRVKNIHYLYFWIVWLWSFDVATQLFFLVMIIKKPLNTLFLWHVLERKERKKMHHV